MNTYGTEKVIEEKVKKYVATKKYPKKFKKYTIIKVYPNYALYHDNKYNCNECFKISDAWQNYWEEKYNYSRKRGPKSLEER